MSTIRPNFPSTTSPHTLFPVVVLPPGLSHIVFMSVDVMKSLIALREHTSSGADNNRLKALKLAAVNLEDPLCKFFQRRLDEMRVPTMWKQGIVTYIRKGGSRVDPSNYRPITLLPVISKIMEAIVAEALMNFLKKRHIIAREQHGSRKY
ncbi:unnamed protein product [Dicrocoelium dendriticum]|nr:unnamed protein product [Dicrocoelium dendriticum]